MNEILSERYNAATHAHTGATVANTIYLINSLPMMALNDADADADNVFVYEADKIRYAKPNDEAWTVGDKLFWDNSGGNVTTTQTGNTFIGFAAEDAATADTEGKVRLAPLQGAVGSGFDFSTADITDITVADGIVTDATSA